MAVRRAGGGGAARELTPLGARPGAQWQVDGWQADMTRPSRPIRAGRIKAQSKEIVVDWNKSAMLVIDMQNDFCHPCGWLAGIGVDVPLAPGARVLEKDSWAAAVVDELAPPASGIRVDKYRMSGFWDTPLESILKNLGVTTLFFGGVNADQCVLATLMDADFLGYDTVLVEDCSATTSPAYCWQATLYNVRRCFGFSATSAALRRSH